MKNSWSLSDDSCYAMKAILQIRHLSSHSSPAAGQCNAELMTNMMFPEQAEDTDARNMGPADGVQLRAFQLAPYRSLKDRHKAPR